MDKYSLKALGVMTLWAIGLIIAIVFFIWLIAITKGAAFIVAVVGLVIFAIYSLAGELADDYRYEAKWKYRKGYDD